MTQWSVDKHNLWVGTSRGRGGGLERDGAGNWLGNRRGNETKKELTLSALSGKSVSEYGAGSLTMDGVIRITRTLIYPSLRWRVVFDEGNKFATM